MSNKNNSFHKPTAYIGFSSIILFVLSFFVVGSLHTDFDLLNDYISKLGTGNSVLAVIWNIVGFSTVGILMAIFGWLYGFAMQDRLTGFLLASFGIAFSFSAIPTQINDHENIYSAVHTAVILISLGMYLFALARILQKSAKGSTISKRANMIVILLILSMILGFSDIVHPPLVHRFIIFVILTWIGMSSFELLNIKTSKV